MLVFIATSMASTTVPFFFRLAFKVLALLASTVPFFLRVAFFFSFIALLVALALQQLSRRWLKKEVPCKSTKYLRKWSKQEEQDAADDIRRIGSREGSHLKDLFQNYYTQDHQKPMNILLTGVTGYVGRSLLWELLSQLEALQCDKMAANDIPKVFLTVRSKRGVSLDSRVQKLRKDPIFQHLQTAWDRHCVTVSVGDMRNENFGMDAGTIRNLEKSNITHIIHSAADVRFTPPFDEIAASNITVSLQLQQFARQWDSCRGMIYLSTAFVHPGQGSSDNPHPDSLVDFKRYDPLELYHSMLGEDNAILAKQVKEELGFENNYTFAKAICEHLLLRDPDTPTKILRPCIVGPSAVLPFPGWNGASPSTVTGFMLLIRVGLANLFRIATKDNRLPVIPVDVVSVAVLHAMISLGEENRKTKKEALEESPKNIANLVWFVEVTPSVFRWWSLSQRFSTWRSALTVLLLQVIDEHPSTEKSLIWAFNVLPLQLWQLSRKLQTPFQTKRPPSQESKMTPEKCLKLLDLTNDYSFFMASKFHFQSSVTMPAWLTSRSYSIRSLLRATENFTPEFARTVPKSLESSTTEMFNYVNLVPKHRSDLWWALTQPNGNLTTRIIGFLVSKVLRRACGRVLVDLSSMAALAEELERDPDAPLCLAATHRSFLDFILLSYVAFSMPEFGLKIPKIAASFQFSSLFFSAFLQGAGAFYLQPGGKLNNAGLFKRLADFLNSKEHLLVFLEGTRSRDRRFLEPKRGFLHALRQAATENGHTDPLVAPVVVDYERIPEQATFENEMTSCGKKAALSSNGLVTWLQKLISKEVQLGDIRITFAEPCRLSEKDDVASFALELQARQKAATSVTTFHLRAAKMHLGTIRVETLQRAIVDLGGRITEQSTSLDLISELSSSECWSLHMQWLVHFAPLLHCKGYEKWAEWIAPGSNRTLTNQDISSDPVLVVLSEIQKLLDSASALGMQAKSLLEESGIPEPTVPHLASTIATLDVDGCLKGTTLAWAAAQIQTVGARKALPGRSTTDEVSSKATLAAVVPRFKNIGKASDTESLGRWGFEDSGFKLVNSRLGSGKRVCFQGSRYRISGRTFPTLLELFEKITKTLISGGPDHAPKAVQKLSLPDEVSTELLDLLKENGFTSDQLSTDVDIRCRHATGHCLEDVFRIQTGEIGRCPDIVIWPLTEQNCFELVELARTFQWCLIPYGGGTNVTKALSCPPKHVDPRPMVSVDMRRMKKILWINREDGLAEIEAGIVGRDLVEELKKEGLTMGHEPDSIEFSTLGGWVATRASGMKKNRYGNIEDIVREVRLVSPSGVLSQNHHQSGRAHEGTAFGRTSIGTELKDLAIGSEGNLGIISSVVVRVHKLPKETQYASILFPCFEMGAKFMRDVARLSPALRPASIRLADNLQFSLAREISAGANDKSMIMKTLQRLYVGSWLRWKPESICACSILCEGDNEEVAFQLKQLRKILGKYEGIEMGASNGASGYEMTFAIAYIRDFALSQGIYGESFETFVPWSRCQALCDGVKRDVQAAHERRFLPGKPVISCRITQLYEEGACVYFYMAISGQGLSNPCDTFAAMEHEARESCMRHGGSLSHHHGVGKVRSCFLPKVNSPALNSWLRDIKDGIDKQNIFGARNGALSPDAIGVDLCQKGGSCEYATDGDVTPSDVTVVSSQTSRSSQSSGSPYFETESFSSLGDTDDEDEAEQSIDSLQAQFEEASETARSKLGSNISNQDKLQLYGLFKQAKHGDADPTNRPSYLWAVERAKFDAWSSLRGTTKESAMKEYSAVVRNLWLASQ
ncbi:Alkyldihydroxyacetonephosphate synthase, peroxisomal [Seminavis robusta]|uniref:alkylglycerone-phosphate synthase n=1 Tax=Seminavis robusta TaxID=568900 RepID=A0A9N8DPE2_9STRA|nr:Alkyldihydroxyacetonephosphate synthase, peroxisomal [Seminavis robusta]|eukprot:Sro244_g097260.1 Alkyldihydroxyacetonephosphate synthase, peroxisomal (1798) ;mRNA; f:68530-74083